MKRTVRILLALTVMSTIVVLNLSGQPFKPAPPTMLRIQLSQSPAMSVSPNPPPPAPPKPMPIIPDPVAPKLVLPGTVEPVQLDLHRPAENPLARYEVFTPSETFVATDPPLTPMAVG